MSGNLVVLEVKPINAATKGIEKDLISITEFVRLAAYKQGMYLVYGGSKARVKSYCKRIQEIAQGENQARIDLEQIELYSHSARCRGNKSILVVRHTAKATVHLLL